MEEKKKSPEQIKKEVVIIICWDHYPWQNGNGCYFLRWNEIT